MKEAVLMGRRWCRSMLFAAYTTAMLLSLQVGEIR